VSGVHGLIGTALTAKLHADGHSVIGLTRSPKAGEIGWDPQAGRLDPGQLEGFDAVVHLAGESIASGRWTAAKKARILESRVSGTSLLAITLAKLQRRPNTFLVASAIGYYGPRPGEQLDEDSASGTGFLAEVCRQWEASAATAREAGIRTIHSRFGMVLSPKGGALKPLLTVAKLGLGGPIGDGRQMWSWIALEDVAGALAHALLADSLAGPMNVVAPNPVPQREFAAILGRVLRRPAFMPLPAFAARLILGHMADELLLPSQHVRPARLLASGYPFTFTELEPALRAML
ncbi:MAG TPA: TIGR01777 family oxidoreductase, partial [Chloroflexota bacterium]|nr:TIGR01777 family oxidoreductase [Chloroflexota bacterium]